MSLPSSLPTALPVAVEPPRTTLAELARVGSPSFLALGFLARMPLAMLPLGMLLLVSAQTGSFTAAGTVVAGLSVGGAVSGTPLGHLADRLGHRPVGLVATGFLGVLLGLFVVATTRSVPTPALVALAVGVGLANPQVGSLARSRWLDLGSRQPDRATFVPAAMGFEGAADEASFVVGPVLVGVLALAGPETALLTALVVAVVAQVGFALHPTAVGPRRRASGRRAPVPVAGVAPLAAIVGCVGLVFGASQTGVSAKLAAAGTSALTGPVYAALGLGSAVSALLVARVLRRVALRHRILASSLGLALTATALLLADGPVALAVTCLLVGLTVAPVLVSAYALVERVVPLDRSATVMAVLATASVSGVALGAAVSGVLIDQVGVRVAQGIPVLAGLLAAGFALTLRASSTGFGSAGRTR